MRTQFSDSQEAFICPLQLCAGRKDLVGPFIYQKVLDAVYSSYHHLLPETEAIATGITDYLTVGRGHDLLLHLQDLQNMLDTQGIAREEHHEIAAALENLREQDMALYKEEGDLYRHNLRLAMTLRDCSLFIRATYEKAGGAFWKVSNVESKLGDLDFKSSRKWEDWKEKEKALIADWYGWYTFDERGVEPFYDCLVAEQQRTLKAEC
jgi:inositol-pentakisphosphate 2-kinase